jgi:hypothetical protein
MTTFAAAGGIEVFFKQVKQSLKPGSFLGHSANAVRWRIFTALPVYVLPRLMAHLPDWGHGFTRLFTVTRSALWERIDLLALLKSYGTASGRLKVPGALNTAWLPGFARARTCCHGTASPCKHRDISTARKKVAIAILPKRAQDLAKSRLRARRAQSVGRL